MRRRLARIAVSTVLVAAALASPISPLPVPVASAAPQVIPCPPGSEWQMRDLVNAYRAANNRASLVLSAELMVKAQAWSDHMAAQNKLLHSTLSNGVSAGWGAIAENIAVNYSVSGAQTALQNSPPHRANLLGSYTEMGLGISEGANGTIWVAQVFVSRGTPTPAYRGPANAGAYQGVAPTVVFDPGAVAAGTTSTFAVAGVGGVPSGATAAVVTLEGTGAATRGWVQALGPGATVGSSSNLNLVDGAAVNTAVVPLATDGTMRLYNSVTASLKVTVTGYFAATGGPANAGRLVALPPSRLFDTRPQYATGYSGAKPEAGDTVTVQVGGRGGVPSSGVRAAVLNVVAVQPEDEGEVQAGAAGMAPGAWRNLLIARPGQVIANLVIVPLDSNGRAALRTTVGTHLVVDVQGWFTGPSAAATTAGLFVPITPARFMDTRGGSPVLGPALVDTARRFDMPACPRAVLGNLTVIPATATSFAQLGPYNQYLGGTYSNLNADVVGAPVANAALVLTGSGYDLGVWTSSPTHVIMDMSGWFV